MALPVRAWRRRVAGSRARVRRAVFYIHITPAPQQIQQVRHLVIVMNVRGATAAITGGELAPC
jgi:hypothetical protein